ncbi:hypothetical protein AVEN_102538-1 [Araneus ventricosus]|uniref:Uncharacterized protein n=1 Tax=Araneus ventricosus TaxID=182803 RepID=A0A4Y2BJP5_ARAVE|nr:hypothetical protein AVEN_102538-1 [Araneus ventricosus]
MLPAYFGIHCSSCRRKKNGTPLHSPRILLQEEKERYATAQSKNPLAGGKRRVRNCTVQVSSCRRKKKDTPLHSPRILLQEEKERYATTQSKNPLAGGKRRIRHYIAQESSCRKKKERYATAQSKKTYTVKHRLYLFQGTVLKRHINEKMYNPNFNKQLCL